MDELLQNADDAGAKRASFLLDHRSHKKSSLFTGKHVGHPDEAGDMASLQGAASLPYLAVLAAGANLPAWLLLTGC